jgi:large subunit ribosomal protein L21
MYALLEIKGKQYKAEKDATLRVDRLEEAEGAKLVFDSVLMVSDDEKSRFGRPYLQDVKVTAVVEGHGRDKKIIVYKHKKRKGYRRKQGHRQAFTLIRIQDIGAPGSAAKSKAGAAAKSKSPAAKSTSAKAAKPKSPAGKSTAAKAAKPKSPAGKSTAAKSPKPKDDGQTSKGS